MDESYCRNEDEPSGFEIVPFTQCHHVLDYLLYQRTRHVVFQLFARFSRMEVCSRMWSPNFNLTKWLRVQKDRSYRIQMNIFFLQPPQKTRFTQGGNMKNLTVSFEQNIEMRTNSTNSAGARLWAAADDRLLIDDRDGPTVERCRLLEKSPGWTGSFRRGVRRAECLQTFRQALSPESDPISQSHSLLLSAEKKKKGKHNYLALFEHAFWK